MLKFAARRNKQRYRAPAEALGASSWSQTTLALVLDTAQRALFFSVSLDPLASLLRAAPSVVRCGSFHSFMFLHLTDSYPHRNRTLQSPRRIVFFFFFTPTSGRYEQVGIRHRPLSNLSLSLPCRQSTNPPSTAKPHNMSDFRSPIDSAVPSLSLQMPQGTTTQQHRRDYSGSITLDDSTQGRRASGDAAAQDGASTDARPGEGITSLHLTTSPDQPGPPPPTDPAVLKQVGEVLASEVRRCSASENAHTRNAGKC